MTTQYWLKNATQFLQSKSIATARLDALVLLEQTLKVDRAKILAEPDAELSDAQVKFLQNVLIRRSKHEPLAYILGRSEFYGRSFVITPNVLVPRPESEAMIELLLELTIVEKRGQNASLARHAERSEGSHLIKSAASTKMDEVPDQVGDDKSETANDNVRIADVGCGSGSLGITAALELKNVQIDLLDIDEDALKTAQTNVDKFTLSLNVIKSDLLAQSPQDYDILLCNLPYVPDDYQINRAARHEPKIALFAGPDGLELYRQLFQQLKIVEKKPLYLLIESLPEQHEPLCQIASDQNYTLLKTDHFIQLFKLT